MLSFLMVHESLYLLLNIYIIDFSSLNIKNLNDKYISQIFLTEESIDKRNIPMIRCRSICQHYYTRNFLSLLE